MFTVPVRPSLQVLDVKMIKLHKYMERRFQMWFFKDLTISAFYICGTWVLL